MNDYKIYIKNQNYTILYFKKESIRTVYLRMNLYQDYKMKRIKKEEFEGNRLFAIDKNIIFDFIRGRPDRVLINKWRYLESLNILPL